MRSIAFEASVIAIGLALSGSVLWTEEAGAYLPGATSSFIDMLPDPGSSSGLVYGNAFTYYHGTASASQDLEFGGLLTAEAKAIVYSETSLFLYQSPLKLLSGQYAVELVVPYVWLNIRGTVWCTAAPATASAPRWKTQPTASVISRCFRCCWARNMGTSNGRRSSPSMRQPAASRKTISLTLGKTSGPSNPARR